MVKDIKNQADICVLSEDDRRALRGSRFSGPPPPLPPSRDKPRLAHPGGPLTTNKAAALAKFLERKLQQPGGLDSLNPDLLELAVKNAKDILRSSGESSNSGRIIRHVVSFGDPSEASGEGNSEKQEKERVKDKKRKKRKKKNKKTKGIFNDGIIKIKKHSKSKE